MKQVAMKTSGNFFTEGANNNLMNNIANAINDNIQFLLVTGGGNGNRGDEMDKSILRSTRDTIGMLYTMKNAITLYKSAKKMGLDNIVLASGMSNPEKYLNIMINSAKEDCIENVLEDVEVMKEILSNGYIDVTPSSLQDNLNKGNHIIVGGGSNYMGFTTDGAVSLMAGNANINTVIKVLTDYAHAYDVNPNNNDEARKIKYISYQKAIEGNIRTVDSNTVYTLLSDRDITLRVAGIKDSLLNILNNEEKVGSTMRKNIKRTVYRKY